MSDLVELELQTALSCHEDAGTRTQVLSGPFSLRALLTSPPGYHLPVFLSCSQSPQVLCSDRHV